MTSVMTLRILNARPFPLRQRMVRDTRNAMLIHPLIRTAMYSIVFPRRLIICVSARRSAAVTNLGLAGRAFPRHDRDTVRLSASVDQAKRLLKTLRSSKELSGRENS